MTANDFESCLRYSSSNCFLHKELTSINSMAQSTDIEMEEMIGSLYANSAAFGSKPGD